MKARGSIAARLATDVRKRGTTASDMFESPHGLIGKPEKIAIAEEVVRLREECGFSDIGLDTGVAEDTERLAQMVAQLAGR